MKRERKAPEEFAAGISSAIQRETGLPLFVADVAAAAAVKHLRDIADNGQVYVPKARRVFPCAEVERRLAAGESPRRVAAAVGVGLSTLRRRYPGGMPTLTKESARGR